MSLNRNTAIAGLILMLAFTVTVASAQVGPNPPEPKVKPENHVGEALSKFLKSKPSATATAPKKKNGSKGAGAGTSDEKVDLSPKTDDQAGANPDEPRISGPVKHPPLLTQPPLENAKVDAPQVDSENPPNINHPKLDDPTNPLGITDAQNRLEKLSTLIDGQRYNEAKPSLTQLRQWLVDLTEAHIGLYKTLNQIPSARAQAELEKELALQFAQLRDRSMVEMAKVYISERDFPKAVKELTQVVQSQPRSKMGLRSYELLQDIGFTEKLQLAQ